MRDASSASYLNNNIHLKSLIVSSGVKWVQILQKLPSDAEVSLVYLNIKVWLLRDTLIFSLKMTLVMYTWNRSRAAAEVETSGVKWVQILQKLASDAEVFVDHEGPPASLRLSQAGEGSCAAGHIYRPNWDED